MLSAFWRTLGYYKVLKAGPRPLFGERHRLWCCELDPGSGWPIEQPSPLPLPGRVRRTASR